MNKLVDFNKKSEEFLDDKKREKGFLDNIAPVAMRIFLWYDTDNR